MLKNIYKVPNGKLLKISLERKNGKIEKISITGDFFAHPENCIEKIEKGLLKKEFEKENLENSIKKIIIKNDYKIFGFDEKSLTEAILGCS